MSSFLSALSIFLVKSVISENLITSIDGAFDVVMGELLVDAIGVVDVHVVPWLSTAELLVTISLALTLNTKLDTTVERNNLLFIENSPIKANKIY